MIVIKIKYHLYICEQEENILGREKRCREKERIEKDLENKARKGKGASKQNTHAERKEEWKKIDRTL